MFAKIEINHDKANCVWTVLSIAQDGNRKVESWHAGDHCDANERRYARERAANDARSLSRKNGDAPIIRTER